MRVLLVNMDVFKPKNYSKEISLHLYRNKVHIAKILLNILYLHYYLRLPPVFDLRINTEASRRICTQYATNETFAIQQENNHRSAEGSRRSI